MILHPYKIVFAGSMGAGKSSAIGVLSDIEVFSTDVMNTDITTHTKLKTTVGIDYGEITLDDGLQIGLYGTPGQDRFDFMWPLICQGAIGTIILIDHASSSALQDLDFYLNKFRTYNLENIIIGITHTDQNRDQSAMIYHDWLKARELDCPLFFVDARERTDILLMIEALLTCVEIKLEQ